MLKPRVAGLVALFAAASCAGGGAQSASDTSRGEAPSGAPSTSTSVASDAVSYIATATGPMIEVYPSATADAAASELANPTRSQAPLTLLLVDEPADSSERLEVHLPVRPNRSTGWIDATAVTITSTTLRLVVDLGAHELTVLESGEPIRTEPIGVGTADTPTPGGVFFLTELLRPPDPSGPYGPFAFGLSGYSDVLADFNGGEGVIGLHGTNDPESIGRDVSHGCIRLHNDVITSLAAELPLGTPVEIRR